MKIDFEKTDLRKNAVSLGVWQQLQQLRSLAAWQLRGFKRRLSWGFTCSAFITTLNFQASKLPNFCKRTALALAFTMAEILISLTIIGVIAAITLPALQANINESAWKAQRKALYSRMSQAISMMPSLNGYGVGETQAETNSKAAMAFVTEGLKPVLKINNICGNSDLSKCGIPSTITTLGNSKIDFPKNLTDLHPMFTSTYTEGSHDYYNPQSYIDTDSVAFETVNGESVGVFYNPFCQLDKGEIKAKESHFAQPKMCANFVFDLNGKKGPNKVGKDIGFMSALYATDSVVVTANPLLKDAVNTSNNTSMNYGEAAAACRKQDANSRVPNLDELSAMFYNGRLLDMTKYNYWSSNKATESSSWIVRFYLGTRVITDNDRTPRVRCIKR